MFRTVIDGLDHPECVIWSPEGFLYAGGEAGQLYRVDPISGEALQLGTSGGWLLGLALDGDGDIHACDPDLGRVFQFAPDGSHTVRSSGTVERPMITPNYAAFGPSGVLYVSDSGIWGEDNGCIFIVSADGHTSVWSTDTPHFPNGLALSEDGQYLYVAESTLPGITRIPISEDGSAGSPHVFLDMPSTVPDGIAFDENGALYIGCYRPDRIYRVIDKQVEVFADDFQGTILAAPTNLAFGDNDGQTLFIANLGRWHIASTRVTAPGLPLHRPSLRSARHV